MSEKRKSTLKAKVLTALLIVLFAGSCASIIFAICTGQLSRDNNTNPTETQPATVTTSATEAVTEATKPSSATAVTTASVAVDTAVTLGSTYDIDYWAEHKSEYGTPGLAVLFGVRTQGVVINFENGRFTVSVINYDEYLPVAEGDYSFVSESEIELRYDNSNIKTAEVIELENGVVTVMDFPLDIEGTTLRASLSQ